MNLVRKRLLPLDSLRGIAACVIAFFWHFQHFGYTSGDPAQPFFNVFGYFYLRGWNLVDFFFVLSGFVIMYSYSDKLLHGHITFRNYLVKRLSRIYPLHFITLCLVAILQIAFFAWGLKSFVYENNNLFHFFLNLLLLQRGLFDLGYSFNGPAWVISLLVYMYILFYFVTVKARNNRYVAFLCLMLLGFVILKNGWPDRDIARAMIGFFSGCLTYGIYTMIQSQSKPRNFTMWIAAAFALGIVVDAKAGLSSFIVFGHSVPFMVWPALVLIALNVPLIARYLSVAPLVYLGRISYSIFLIHFPVQFVIFFLGNYYGFDLHSIYLFFVYVLSVLLLAGLSKKYLEIPLQNIIRRDLLKK